MTNAFLDAITEAVARHPDKIAIRCGHETRTYAEFGGSVSAFAERLRHEGILPGDRVGISYSDRLSYIVAFYGTLFAGAVVVTVDLADESDTRVKLSDVAPRIVAAESPRDGFSVPVVPISPTTSATAGPLPIPSRKTTDPAAIFFTSGTAGERKGVVQSFDNFACTNDNLRDVLGMDSSIVEYIASPIDHAFGLGRVRAVLALGGTVVLHAGAFDPLRALKILKDEAINAVSGSSSVFLLLMKTLERPLGEIGPRIKWIEVGSAPMAPEDKKRMTELFSEAEIVMNYGLTEAMRSTFLRFRSDQDHLDTVGRAAPRCAIAIRSESGEELPPGEVGHIHIKGRNVALGYWGRDEVWDERCVSGWYNTRDMGCLDNKSFLTFIGRDDDLINVGGEKISPVDLEILLEPALAGIDFCVCGFEDRQGVFGEVPAICVEAERGRSLDWATVGVAVRTLRTGLRPPVAFYVETIPRTRNGKIQRKVLKDRIAKGQYESIRIS